MSSRCTAVHFNTISFRFTPLGIEQVAVLWGRVEGLLRVKSSTGTKKYLFADEVNTT